MSAARLQFVSVSYSDVSTETFNINLCLDCVYSQNGLTALHLAAKEGHDTVVHILLSRGADVLAATRVCDSYRSCHRCTVESLHRDAKKRNSH